MSEAAFLALQDDFTSDNLPESLAFRAVNIGELRRRDLPMPSPPTAEGKYEPKGPLGGSSRPIGGPEPGKGPRLDNSLPAPGLKPSPDPKK